MPLHTGAAWTSAGAALIAAVLCGGASLIRVPPFPDVGFDSASSLFQPIHRALRRASRLNAWSAGFAAVAATAGGLAALPMALASQCCISARGHVAGSDVDFTVWIDDLQISAGRANGELLERKWSEFNERD